MLTLKFVIPVGATPSFSVHFPSSAVFPVSFPRVQPTIADMFSTACAVPVSTHVPFHMSLRPMESTRMFLLVSEMRRTFVLLFRFFKLL